MLFIVFGCHLLGRNCGILVHVLSEYPVSELLVSGFLGILIFFSEDLLAEGPSPSDESLERALARLLLLLDLRDRSLSVSFDGSESETDLGGVDEIGASTSTPGRGILCRSGGLEVAFFLAAIVSFRTRNVPFVGTSSSASGVYSLLASLRRDLVLIPSAGVSGAIIRLGLRGGDDGLAGFFASGLNGSMRPVIGWSM